MSHDETSTFYETPRVWSMVEGKEKASVEAIVATIESARDAELTWTDDNDTTIVMSAVWSYQPVRVLTALFERPCLRSKQIIRARDSHGCTAVHIAALNGNSAALAVLAFARADLNARDNMGMTAVHCCVVKNNAEGLDELLRQGAETNVKDWHGNTPWLIAKQQHHLSCTRVFREFQRMAHTAERLLQLALDGSLPHPLFTLRAFLPVVGIVLRYVAVHR